MKTHYCTNGFAPVHLRFARCAAVLLTCAVIAGCSPNPKEKIVIRGSNTFGEELAPKLIAEFKKENPTVDFDAEFKGTSYGLGALMVGRCDIAAASREATTNELALSPIPNLQLNNYVVGSYSVAVVVNAGNSVTNLTQQQVRDVFTGAVQNWKEVGGADAPIHLYIRNPISGTYLGFQELAMDKKPYGIHTKSFTNYVSIIKAVEEDAAGIGYSSIDLTSQSGIRPLAIGGIAPSADSVNKGKYPYKRVLRLYTDKSNELADAGAFANFVLSTEGQKIVSEMGYVPRP